MSETNVTTNKEHKDRLFNFIFGSEEHKDWTLQLYNAVNGSDYKDESQISFNTLQNYLFVSMRNDTSFIITDTMNLYEHQATYNPNMPLRMLRYVSNLYSKYVKENSLDVFGEAQLKLPVPKLVVFYNGEKKVEDEKFLYLSDSFEEGLKEKSDIEVKVRMLNINYGHNSCIINTCKPLREYAWFIAKIRAYKKEYGIEKAASMAVNEMPEEFEIKKFLKNNMAEVIDMMLAEDQELDALELIAKANEKKGIKQGIEQGIGQGIDITIKNMINSGSFTDEQIQTATGKDSNYIKGIRESISGDKTDSNK
ncbi:MAG: hypothetical protein E7302_04335 [Butyrivibrio sp.]|nr:hypothetical protein [Butyrivibrio sp.]